MNAFLTILHLLTAILLIVVVLLQRGRGGGLAGLFGGGGGTPFGIRTAGFLVWTTAGLFFVMLLTALILAARGGG